MFKDTLSPPLQWLKNRARHLQRRYGIDRRLAVFDARRDFCDFTQLRDAQLPKLLKAIREEPKRPTLVIITREPLLLHRHQPRLGRRRLHQLPRGESRQPSECFAPDTGIEYAPGLRLLLRLRA